VIIINGELIDMVILCIEANLKTIKCSQF